MTVWARLLKRIRESTWLDMWRMAHCGAIKRELEALAAVQAQEEQP